jgi:O-methyltransferase
MKIVAFGTGSGFRDFLSVLPNDVEILGLSDNDTSKHGTEVSGHAVLPPDEIKALPFDFVVVTTRTGEAIRVQLMEMGIERERILVYYSSFESGLRNAVNRDMEALNRHLGLGLHPLALCTMQMWPQRVVEGMWTEDDFCRMMSMRLSAERVEQQGVPGAIAELGVYKGEMAAVLSRLFPTRKLYLFDTFEGFSANDLGAGAEGQHSKAQAGEFQDTSVELVLARLANPERVEVRKGYFPETAEGLEDTFALVSLDVDLYKPTLAGLHYFYPRLSKGGYIFVHDYNNRRFEGVKAAVDEFSAATGAALVQLPDLAGTIVVAK